MHSGSTSRAEPHNKSRRVQASVTRNSRSQAARQPASAHALLSAHLRTPLRQPPLPVPSTHPPNSPAWRAGSLALPKARLRTRP